MMLLPRLPSSCCHPLGSVGSVVLFGLSRGFQTRQFETLPYLPFRQKWWRDDGSVGRLRSISKQLVNPQILPCRRLLCGSMMLVSGSKQGRSIGHQPVVIVTQLGVVFWRHVNVVELQLVLHPLVEDGAGLWGREMDM